MDGDGMLSQDEINALLNGMDLSDDGGNSGNAPADSGSSAAGNPGNEAEIVDDSLLTDVEKDAIGEVANISMGSSATTLYSLVNKKVNITTPVVSLARWKSMLDEYERPCVFIQIKYTQGLDGTNILVLKDRDVKIITDLMMGGDGTNVDGGEITELHLSAISEAMNQMMGSSATSLSTMLGTMIDISPPSANLLDLADYADGAELSPFLGGTFVKVRFSMQIGDLVDSNIMQLYPVEFAKNIVDTFIGAQMGDSEPEPAPAPAPQSVAQPQPGMDPQMMGMQPQMGMNPQMMGMQPQMGMDPQMMGMQPQMGMNPQMMGMQPQMGMNPQMMGMQPQMGMNAYGYNSYGQMPMQNVNVQPAQFQNFSGDLGAMASNENIGLIMDVPLEVTVELGRTIKSISDILDFAPGTIIELNRIAGEPIDVLVNGKFVAKGEVVVIEECFGIKVTEIIK
ncbi:MAG: flagellar motor switch phosphatase FliY [Lachnospiraceae bacterium]|nr:flagellar motor switch phosphatase FliY [Lachnospiraceae bacterium]